MKLHSDSFADGHAIPERCAMGTPTGLGGNRNPQLSWTDLPEGTQSLLLWCVDPDVPTVAEMVGKAGVEIPVEQPRCEFTHWLLADIPVAVSQIAEGAWSDGVTDFIDAGRAESEFKIPAQTFKDPKAVTRRCGLFYFVSDLVSNA